MEVVHPSNSNTSSSSPMLNDGRSVVGSGTICHVLPCSIDQDITAPIAQYFHPTPLDVTTPSSTTTSTVIMAAQFRGRGLLCAVDAPKSSLTVSEEGPTTSTATTTSTSASGSTLISSINNNNDDDECATSTTLSKLPSNIMGVVLTPTSSNSYSTASTTIHRTATNHHTTSDNSIPTIMQQPLKAIETFQHIYNWQHEHDVPKVLLQQQQQANTEKYGLNAVREWCDLSQSIHDPIPVPTPPASTS